MVVDEEGEEDEDEEEVVSFDLARRVDGGVIVVIVVMCSDELALLITGRRGSMNVVERELWSTKKIFPFFSFFFLPAGGQRLFGVAEHVEKFDQLFVVLILFVVDQRISAYFLQNTN